VLVSDHASKVNEIKRQLEEAVKKRDEILAEIEENRKMHLEVLEAFKPIEQYCSKCKKSSNKLSLDNLCDTCSKI